MPQPIVPQLATEGNYRLENFGPAELAQARAAVREVKDLCALMQNALNPRTLGETKAVVRIALAAFFGVKEDVAYNKVKSELNRLNVAVTTGNVTLVYRPDIVVRDANGAPAQLGGGTAFTGANVFGYVQHHQVGSGYRVVCGKHFISDPTPYYASTTIYHEMSHKVLKTLDLGYGEATCKSLGSQGIRNADSYAYFAIAIGKGRARL